MWLIARPRWRPANYKGDGELNLTTFIVCLSKCFAVSGGKEVEEGSKGMFLRTFPGGLYGFWIVTSIHEETVTQPVIWERNISNNYCTFQNFSPSSDDYLPCTVHKRIWKRELCNSHCFLYMFPKREQYLSDSCFPFFSLPSFFSPFCKAPNCTWIHLVLVNNCLSILLHCPENKIESCSSLALSGAIIISVEKGYFSRETF